MGRQNDVRGIMGPWDAFDALIHDNQSNCPNSFRIVRVNRTCPEPIEVHKVVTTGFCQPPGGVARCATSAGPHVFGSYS